MQRIPVSYLKPGMKTFEEVYDPNGRTICGRGVELTQELIDKFVSMGVKYVTVEGTPVDLPWERSYEEEIEELNKRFEGITDENLLALKGILEDFFKEKFKKT